MASTERRRLTVDPEIQAKVDSWPPIPPERKARLRRALADWPDQIEARIRERHPELADTPRPAA